MLRSRFFIDIVVPTLCVCWAAVLAYSAFAGEAGYGTLSNLRQQFEQENAELEVLRRRRETLEKRADLLNSNSLDRDLVDERIRSVLGFSADGDLIIPRNELRRSIDRAPSSNP